MLMRSRWEGAALAAVTLALAAGCGGGGGGASDASDTATAEAAAPAAAQTSSAPLAVTAADLDVYERGLRREIEVVRAAQERARAATTPAERAAAAQAQWADQTMPEGARSAGVPAERYREIREAVDGVLQTLDFQGKIDGPLTLDTTRVSPEMRERLRGDPLAALPPASAAAVRARLPRLAPIWAQYKELTAVAG